MSIVALYVDNRRYVLEDSTSILSRANQALATLERYKLRLDEVAGTLSALEIEDLVTARDVSAVGQRLEMVRRISDEIDGYVVELGTDGRLLSLQLDELVAGVAADRELIARDYLPSAGSRRPRTVEDALSELDNLSASDLLDLSTVARALGFPAAGEAWTPPSARAATACWPRSPGCRDGGRPAGRALRQPAEAAGRQHRRPAGGRGRRRVARPHGARRPLPPRRVQHPRALRLTSPEREVRPVQPGVHPAPVRFRGKGRAVP
jgi:hypothetical protein